ncbi:MAG: hypothetical protein AB1921_14110 [Thermodesulfobacteriota bacterium]
MSPVNHVVTTAVRAAFTEKDVGLVLDLLSRYGLEPCHREPERVRLAIVKLSKGSLERLLYLLETAKKDYRDVLCWIETGELSEPEGEKTHQAALDLIQRWGGK